jgi:hypothetical protein
VGSRLTIAGVGSWNGVVGFFTSDPNPAAFNNAGVLIDAPNSLFIITAAFNNAGSVDILHFPHKTQQFLPRSRLTLAENGPPATMAV